MKGRPITNEGHEERIGGVEQRDAADEGRLEAYGTTVVGTVIANEGKVVRPSQLIASVRRMYLVARAQRARVTRLAIVASITLGLAGCTPRAAVLSQECDVAVSMPGLPRYRTSTTKVRSGSITHHTYGLTAGDLTLAMVCTPDLRRVGDTDPHHLLRLAKESALDTDSELIGEAPVSWDGHPGLEVTVRRRGYILRSRVYVLPDATVDLTVMGPEVAVVGPAAQDFFGSLRKATP